MSIMKECRSCLETKNAILMRGRLCSNCIQTAGRSMHSLDTEDAIFKNTRKDGRTPPVKKMIIY